MRRVCSTAEAHTPAVFADSRKDSAFVTSRSSGGEDTMPARISAAVSLRACAIFASTTISLASSTASGETSAAAATVNACSAPLTSMTNISDEILCASDAAALSLFSSGLRSSNSDMAFASALISSSCSLSASEAAAAGSDALAEMSPLDRRSRMTSPMTARDIGADSGASILCRLLGEFSGAGGFPTSPSLTSTANGRFCSDSKCRGSTDDVGRFPLEPVDDIDAACDCASATAARTTLLSPAATRTVSSPPLPACSEASASATAPIAFLSFALCLRRATAVAVSSALRSSEWLGPTSQSISGRVYIPKRVA